MHFKCKNWDPQLSCIMCIRVRMCVALKKFNCILIMSDVFLSRVKLLQS